MNTRGTGQGKPRGLAQTKAKTKTPKKTKSPTSKRSPAAGSGANSSEISQELAEAIAGAGLSGGHRPTAELTPQDETLFRAFQSNLLSLISHELRTPLTGILNALSLLDEGESAQADTEFSAAELVAMARRNAQRLSRTLSALLDLAAIESGTFHLRLREVDLSRIVESRIRANGPFFRERAIEAKLEIARDAQLSREGSWILADPQKLGRAIDLCFHSIVPRAVHGSTLRISVQPSRVELGFELEPQARKPWESAWMTGVAGFQGGVASPVSAFSATVQSEEAFLTRSEEGLGNEFLLVHEILRRHGGKFDAPGTDVSSGHVRLVIELPELTSEEGLQAVLASRIHENSPDHGSLGNVALGLIAVPEGQSVEEFRARVKKFLFRASDAVYSLPERRQVALVLDDCKPEDAPKLLQRVERGFGSALKWGAIAAPTEGVEPSQLLELATRRLETKKTS